MINKFEDYGYEIYWKVLYIFIIVLTIRRLYTRVVGLSDYNLKHRCIMRC